MSEEPSKSYYAIIPANVRYDTELTPNAKLLYGEITALCNEKGYCWATNEYFSKLYGVSKTSISKWINSLIKKKYISSEFIYKEGTKEIEYRYLRIVQNPIEEKLNTPVEEKLNTPIEEKLKDNNTSFNNTLFNNTNNKKKVSKKESFDDLIDAYTINENLKEELKNHLSVRKASKGALTNRALELSFKKLNELTKQYPVNEQEKIKIKIVQQSIERGWVGFFPYKEVADTSTQSRQNYAPPQQKSTLSRLQKMIAEEEGIINE